MESKNHTETRGLWELANDVESVAYKIDSVANVVEMVASSIINEPESGAAWAAREMLEKYVDDLEKLSGEIMKHHRATLVAEQPKKGKKK
jgi:hypothetical protein